MSLIIVLLISLVGISWFIINKYDTLIRLIKQVDNSKNQIDVQLDKRYKVFESLINTVKKIMDYESSTLKDIVQLRNKSQECKKNGSEKERILAEEQISKIASQINVVFEQYPNLKAMNNAQQLQEEIVSIENQLSFAKQSYNDYIMIYETERDSFFGSIIIKLFGNQLNRNFNYWNLSIEKSQAYEEKVVNF